MEADVVASNPVSQSNETSSVKTYCKEGADKIESAASCTNGEKSDTIEEVKSDDEPVVETEAMVMDVENRKGESECDKIVEIESNVEEGECITEKIVSSEDDKIIENKNELLSQSEMIDTDDGVSDCIEEGEINESVEEGQINHSVEEGQINDFVVEGEVILETELANPKPIKPNEKPENPISDQIPIESESSNLTNACDTDVQIEDSGKEDPSSQISSDLMTLSGENATDVESVQEIVSSGKSMEIPEKQEIHAVPEESMDIDEPQQVQETASVTTDNVSHVCV